MQIEGFAVDENAMWYLVPSAKQMILKSAAELGQKRLRIQELQRQLSSASGLQTLVLKNEIEHLRRECSKLYEGLAQFEVGMPKRTGYLM